jgi:hypothetical protein
VDVSAAFRQNISHNRPPGQVAAHNGRGIMAIRFRRRIKLAPGLHLNVSGSGLSLSAGPRGASMTFGGRRGAYMITGIPGTGLYARQRVGATAQPLSPATSPATNSSGTGTVSITITVENDGTVVFRDEEGSVLDDRLTRRAKQQAKDAIQELMQRACDEINSQVETLNRFTMPRHRRTGVPPTSPNRMANRSLRGRHRASTACSTGCSAPDAPGSTRRTLRRRQPITPAF